MLIQHGLVVRKARAPDFGKFEFSQVAVTPENNDKTTHSMEKWKKSVYLRKSGISGLN